MFYTKLDNRDYFDLVVTKDCRDFYRDINECKLISIDLTKSLCSDPGIVQSESVELKNITLTGYDNFFIASGTTFNLQNFVWMTSSPYWFNTTFTWNGNSGADGTITGLTQNNSNLILNIDPNLTYIVETGDTFCLHEVSGYTEQYTYGIDHLQLDKGVYYNELKGGFYQGFYKIFGQNVEWFPSRAKRGWTVDMIVHFPMDISGSTTGTTLNNVYPSNSGFVFYMGTRAENKFIDETPIEIQKLNNSYNIVPLNTENLYTYNNLITLDGTTKYIGYFNYYNGQMFTGRQYDPATSELLSYFQDYSDLAYNAFGIRVTNDGRIGYRTMYPTDVCYTGQTQDITGITLNVSGDPSNLFVQQSDDECLNYTKSLIVTKYLTIEECYTKKPVIDVTEDKFLEITAVFERDFSYANDCELKYGTYKKGTLSIYLNGFLVFRNKQFIEVIPHELNTDSKLQEGVPFNISFGGGTQNLMDAIYLDNQKTINTVLEKFFAGTFMGGVKSIDMYCLPLYTTEIRKIASNMADIYGLNTIKGGRQIFINKLF